jgi:hypothetical protein
MEQQVAGLVHTIQVQDHRFNKTFAAYQITQVCCYQTAESVLRLDAPAEPSPEGSRSTGGKRKCGSQTRIIQGMIIIDRVSDSRSYCPAHMFPIGVPS